MISSTDLPSHFNALSSSCRASFVIERSFFLSIWLNTTIPALGSTPGENREVRRNG